jgi:hypothetical protein
MARLLHAALITVYFHNQSPNPAADRKRILRAGKQGREDQFIVSGRLSRIRNKCVVVIAALLAIWNLGQGCKRINPARQGCRSANAVGFFTERAVAEMSLTQKIEAFSVPGCKMPWIDD